LGGTNALGRIEEEEKENYDANEQLRAVQRQL
jgi:hypothetical protein